MTLETLKRYCAPDLENLITQQPWTSAMQRITWATNGHIQLVLPWLVAGCPQYGGDRRNEIEIINGLKNYDKTAPMAELKILAPNPAWPSLPADCTVCCGSQKVKCCYCKGTGGDHETVCAECDESEGCDETCPACSPVLTPYSPVWLDDVMVNSCYLARILEAFESPDVFFYVTGPSNPIFLSDGNLRASTMPMIPDASKEEFSKIRLKELT